MKKLIRISLLLMLAAALAGCGKKTDSNGNTETATTAPVAQQQTAAEETETGGSVEDATVKPTVRERNIVSNDTYEYEIYEGGAIITKYKGSMTAPVVEIGFYAFEAKPVTSVTLPETVKVIGEGAFIDCASLAGMKLPAALTDIERGAFAGCTALQGAGRRKGIDGNQGYLS